MVVGVCQMRLALPGNDSLKGKRAVVRSVVERTAHRFNVAIAEVGAQDAHRRALLGFAVVSNDVAHANAMLDRIAAAVERAAEQAQAVPEGRTIEILHVGEEADVAGHLGSWADYEDPDEPADEDPDGIS
ncbi:MAG: DUF503 domain-containing protein [Myxococcales bacterium]|nr:DUF503 domain-containing protein [Myxococcales bacterium]